MKKGKNFGSKLNFYKKSPKKRRPQISFIRTKIDFDETT